MKKHSVIFHSPGTLFDETTAREVTERDPKQAALLAADIVERYGAKPYGFRFVTMLVADPVPDGEGGTLNVEPKEIERTGMHYLGGTVIRFDDIPDDKASAILRSNAQGNGWPLVVECRNSYRSVHPFVEGDTIVDALGNITDRGDDPRHIEYRATMTTRWAAQAA